MGGLNSQPHRTSGVQSHDFRLLAADVQADLLCEDFDSLSLPLNV